MNKIITSSVLKNFSNLAFINVLTMLIPFFYYPYLIRVLGGEIYGKVLYIQVLYSFLAILIQFGFSISATKNVSLCRDDSIKLSEIYSSVFYIKLALTAISLCIIGVFFAVVELSQEDFMLHISCSVILIGDLFLIHWFYQGIEKMQYVSIATLINKLLLLALIFIFVNGQDDAVFFASAFSVSYIAGNFTMFVFAKYRFGLRFVNVPFDNLKITFIDSYNFFLSRLSAVLVERLNISILGLTGNLSDIAYYDLAAKLVGLAQMPFGMLNQAYYPHATRERNKFKVYKVINILLVLSVIVYVSSSLCIDFVIETFAGGNMLGSVIIFYILAITIIINVPSHFVGNCLLVVNNQVRTFNRSVVIGSLLYSAFIALIYTFDLLNVLALSIGFVIYNLFVCIYRCTGWVYFVRR